MLQSVGMFPVGSQAVSISCIHLEHEACIGSIWTSELLYCVERTRLK